MSIEKKFLIKEKQKLKKEIKAGKDFSSEREKFTKFLKENNTKIAI